MDVLEGVVSSKTRAKIFELFFIENNPEYYLRELQRLTGLSTPAIRFEMDNLIDIDLIKSEKDGNRTYFKANILHPLFNTIQEMINITRGPHIRLQKAFDNNKAIELAFIFGSYAKDSLKANSDIDLFIIGKIKNLEISQITFDIQKDIMREINYHKFSRTEITKKLQEDNHFLKSLKKEKIIFVKGDQNDFKEIFGK